MTTERISLMDAFPCGHCGSEAHTGNQHVEMYGEPTPSPVPVNGTVGVHGAVRTNEEAADFGAYTTYPVTATDVPIRVLSHDDNRARAVLSVDGTTNSVWIGKREQIYATGGAQGSLLSSGQPLEIRNKQEVWMAPNAVACNLSVLNERWENK